MSLVKQWEQEVKTKVKADYQLKLFVFHGEKRAPASELMEYDVVLTSYGTVVSEHKRLKNFWKENADRKVDVENDIFLKQCTSLLHPWDSHFHRIILDESQHIKNSLTQTSEAVAEVKATYRWCLTGTPMMNGVDEMYALYRFLKVHPYSDWAYFAKSFGTLFDTKQTSGNPRMLAMRNFQVLLKATMLRRSKFSMVDGQPLLALPEKTEENVEVTLSADELHLYNEIKKKSQVMLSQFMGATKTIGLRFGHVLELLLRLRQACCHPFLLLNSEPFIPEVDAEMLERAESLTEGQVNRILRLTHATTDGVTVAADESIAGSVDNVSSRGNFKCSGCSTTTADPIFVYPCSHEICIDCLAKLSYEVPSTENKEAECPACKGPMDKNTIITYDAFKQIHTPELVDLSRHNNDEEDAQAISQGPDGNNEHKESGKSGKMAEEERPKIDPARLTKFRHSAYRNIASRQEYIRYLEEC